jgi:hypothetical protein
MQSGWDKSSQYKTLVSTAQREGKGGNRDNAFSSLLRGLIESLMMLRARRDSSYTFDSSKPAHSGILRRYSFHQRRSVLSSAAEGA